MDLSEVLDFLEHCSHIDINLREGGYRIMAYVGQEQKWNTPHLVIIVTDYPLPTPKFLLEVEYRKEQMFTSDKKTHIEAVRAMTHKRYHEIIEKKDCEMKKEFDVILKDMKKN